MVSKQPIILNWDQNQKKTTEFYFNCFTYFFPEDSRILNGDCFMKQKSLYNSYEKIRNSNIWVETDTRADVKFHHKGRQARNKNKIFPVRNLLKPR